MQRLPFPHLVAQRYDHGELQAAVSGVVQNDVPDELHKKGILHQRTPEAIRIVAISEPMYAALIIYEGIFHGIGDTKMPFIFAILTMWGIRIGLTWIYIGMYGRDLKMVWFFMIMDNISRCILLWGLYRRRKRSLLLFDEY